MGGHANYRPTKYHSIDEIPDSLVKTFSERDPNNQVYKTKRWMNFKKRQILFSQQDGVPNYLRTRAGRFMYYTTVTGLVLNFAYNIYLFNKLSSKK